MAKKNVKMKKKTREKHTHTHTSRVEAGWFHPVKTEVTWAELSTTCAVASSGKYNYGTAFCFSVFRLLKNQVLVRIVFSATYAMNMLIRHFAQAKYKTHRPSVSFSKCSFCQIEKQNREPRRANRYSGDRFSTRLFFFRIQKKKSKNEKKGRKE